MLCSSKTATAGLRPVAAAPAQLLRYNGLRQLPQQQRHQQWHPLQWQQQQGLLRPVVARATDNEDEVFERMKREADAGDMWGNEIVATLLKVALVALFITVAVLLLDAAHPIVSTTVERFPTAQRLQ